MLNHFSQTYAYNFTCSDGSIEKRYKVMSKADADYYLEERDGEYWMLTESEARRRAWGKVKLPFGPGGMADDTAWQVQQIIKQNINQYEY